MAYEQEAGNTCWRQRQNKSTQGPIQIASLPLNQYRPDEISLDVDSVNITLHGQHRTEDENGFENSEFKKVIKIPEGVDPTSVTSRASQDGGSLVLEGIKRIEESAKKDDGKFSVKLDLSGFKPEEIKVQRRGQELTVTGKHRSEDSASHWSRDYCRRIVLSDDVDLRSVTSRLSKEGQLVIEAPRDPALLPSERSVDVTTEVDEPQTEEEARPKTSQEEGE